jgi:hypothetical protein
MSSDVFGQSKQNLSEQLWGRTQSCYSDFEDTNNDGKLDDTKIIDDSKNGYLKISGSIGTCGCSCSKTIAAFKNKKENYTFIEQEISDCSWSHKVSSNRKLIDILPKGFSIHTFIPTLKDEQRKQALFYLDFNIPQYGTDTEVTLKIIPFGMNIESDKVLIYEISEDNNNVHLQESNDISQVFTTLSSESINGILDNQIDKISKPNRDLIIATIKKKDKKVTLDNFSNQLRELKKIYDLYVSIEHKSILLKWDKEKEKFYIDKKGEAIKLITFKEFLRNKTILKYWMAIC